MNIAARLQSFALPGGIVLPRELATMMERAPGVQLHDLGELPLRNIQRPVEAVSLSFGGTDTRSLGDVASGANTVSGLVMAEMESVPSVGDKAQCGDVMIEIVDMDGQRIDRLLVTLTAPNESTPPAAQ